MSKIPLPQNKETIVAVALATALIVLGIINALLLAPALIDIYAPSTGTTNQSPIDTKTVNAAIEFLNLQ